MADTMPPADAEVTPPRRPVAKRVRFEVMRRDNHACRYCGAMAPDAKLTIDHVVPVALGGSDDPTNLVTACVDCNAGKASTAPDSTVVDDVAQDALRWADAMKVAAQALDAKARLLRAAVDQVDDVWSAFTYGWKEYPVPRPDDWRRSIEQWVKAGLSADVMCDLVRVAMAKQTVPPAQTWRYFCGCCWKKLSELQEAAKAILAVEDLAKDVLARRDAD